MRAGRHEPAVRRVLEVLDRELVELPRSLGRAGLRRDARELAVAAAEVDRVVVRELLRRPAGEGRRGGELAEGGSGRSYRDEIANGSAVTEVIGTGVFTAASSLFTSDLPPADLKGLVPKIGNRPVFFIYGENGQPAEQPANEGFYEAARGPKEIWEVPGSGHMKGIEAQPQEYERRVVGFFDRALPGEETAP